MILWECFIISSYFILNTKEVHIIKIASSFLPRPHIWFSQGKDKYHSSIKMEGVVQNNNSRVSSMLLMSSVEKLTSIQLPEALLLTNFRQPILSNQCCYICTSLLKSQYPYTQPLAFLVFKAVTCEVFGWNCVCIKYQIPILIGILKIDHWETSVNILGCCAHNGNSFWSPTQAQL